MLSFLNVTSLFNSVIHIYFLDKHKFIVFPQQIHIHIHIWGAKILFKLKFKQFIYNIP